MRNVSYAVVGAAAFALACGSFGSAPDAADASSSTSGGSSASVCPSERGSPMIRVAAGASAYCIDVHETTNKEYVAFLDAAVPTTGQPPECAWNTSFAPFDTVNSAPMPPDVAASPTKPILYVDWCDALAYCRWVGKRLCGKIGGGAHSFATPEDVSTDEWAFACSRGNTRAFPYGDTYDPGHCNDGTAGGLAAVGSFSGCQGGVDGLMDMSGNVEEWEDSCAGPTGPDDPCHRRGGSYKDADEAPTVFRCDQVFTPTAPRSFATDDVGIRCCAD